MSKSASLTRKTAFAGIIAAMYIALTQVFIGTSFGLLQFRAAEALTVLPFLFPAAIPGLFAGCFLSNLMFSEFGAPDLIFGSLATLSAAFLTAQCKNRWVAALPPVIINAVVIGIMLNILLELGAAAILFSIATVGIGQLVVCYGLGVPLTYALEKAGLHKKLSSNGGKQ
jgi:uncharacterized membrane protein